MFVLATTLSTTTACAAHAQPLPSVMLPRIGQPNSPVYFVELVGESVVAEKLRDEVDLAQVEDALIGALTEEGIVATEVEIRSWSLLVPTFEGPARYGYTARIDGKNVRCSISASSAGWEAYWASSPGGAVDPSPQSVYDDMATSCASKAVRKL